jgi:hypothetical protein
MYVCSLPWDSIACGLLSVFWDQLNITTHCPVASFCCLISWCKGRWEKTIDSWCKASWLFHDIRAPWWLCCCSLLAVYSRSWRQFFVASSLHDLSARCWLRIEGYVHLAIGPHCCDVWVLWSWVLFSGGGLGWFWFVLGSSCCQLVWPWLLFCSPRHAFCDAGDWGFLSAFSLTKLSTRDEQLMNPRWTGTTEHCCWGLIAEG